MPYIVMTTLKADSEERRLEIRPLHLQYLEKNKHRRLAGGARISDDGEDTYGGLFIVDSEDRSEADEFIDNEPLNRNGLFETIAITRWRKAVFDHEKLI